METNGISLFDQQPEEPKKDRRTAFLLGGIAALGVAGALGVGFVIGGRGGDGRDGGVDGASVSPTQQAQGSPTANPQTQDANPQPAGQAPAGKRPEQRRRQPRQRCRPARVGRGRHVGCRRRPRARRPPPPPPPPPPADKHARPADEAPPVPPTSTPVPPTSTPTSTPTATPTATPPPMVPCPWCPIIDPGIIIIDPGVFLPITDIWAPEFTSASFAHCPDGYHVSFEVNENAEMWVSFERLWADETAHVNGTAFSAVVAEGFFLLPRTTSSFTRRTRPGTRRRCPRRSGSASNAKSLGQREGRLR